MKNKIILSVFTALLFGGLGYFILWFLEIPNAFLFAVMCGLLFYILMFIVLIAYEKAMNKKYAKIESQFNSPVFYKANGNFNLGTGKIKNGNIYFCEAGIVCVCLDDKPYSLDEILLCDIKAISYDNIHFNILTKDGRVFLITIPYADKIIEILKEKGWLE